MVLFGQSGCIRAKVFVFRQGGCFRESGWIRAKVVVTGKLLYPGKNCCILEKGLNSGKSVCIRAKLLY